MHFITVNGVTINVAHIVQIIQNKVSGDVKIFSVIGEIGIPFPYGGEFMKQFEALEVAKPAPAIIGM